MHVLVIAVIAVRSLQNSCVWQARLTKLT